MAGEGMITRAPDLWSDRQRRRLVRLCTALTRDPDAADDLAQETLLEAWRNANKLRDPSGADRWLNAIARNVCLRWARNAGRDAKRVGAAAAAAAVHQHAADVDAAREEAQVAALLDRALGLLPPETRAVLVDRYVHERSQAAIADELGVSEDAVSMRVSRGKQALRGLLGTQLRDDALAHGLPVASADWRETRIWCSDCGRRRLLVRAEPPPGALSFRCPGCEPDARRPGSEFPLGNPVFADLLGGLVRPTAIHARTHAWSRAYFAPGAGGTGVACTRCGKPVRLSRYSREDRRHRHGLVATCDACGEQVSSSVGGLAVAQPGVEAFRREHPRTRALPARGVEHGGVPTLVLRYESILDSAAVDVLFARATLRVLDVRAA
jgi:RNA polymerase sigma factor (sigma-70 family)